MKKPIGLLKLKKNLRTKDASNNKKIVVETKTKAEDAKMLRRKNLRACVN
jgi:hypothetical protein